MDVATQIVFITYSLLMLGVSFTLIGKEPEDDNLRSGFGILAFLYGLFTVAFLIWWEPVNTVESVARWATIGLMWVPFMVDLPKINNKPKTPTTLDVLQSAVLNLTRVALVLVFWVL